MHVMMLQLFARNILATYSKGNILKFAVEQKGEGRKIVHFSTD